MVLEAEERLAAGERVSMEYRMIARDGSVVWVHDEATPRDHHGMRLLDGLLTDVSDRKAAEARLQHLADHDALTGLLNRRRFMEELELEIAVVRRGMRTSSAIVLDIDGFKHVNDTYGHQAGDEMLRGIATVLGERLRTSDAVARLGGDEFAILLRGTSPEGAEEVGAELLGTLRGQPFAARRRPRAGDRQRGCRRAGGRGTRTPRPCSPPPTSRCTRASTAGATGSSASRPACARSSSAAARGSPGSARRSSTTASPCSPSPCSTCATGRIAQHELLLRLRGRRRRARRARRVPARRRALRPRRGDRPLGAARARCSSSATPR